MLGGHVLNLEDLLEVIQSQRHDFLNHLQVISGLLQLNKVDRAREYIDQVSLEAAQYSKTTQVSIPEVTAALLVGFNNAFMSQIVMELTVNSNLSNCAVPGPVVGQALELSLNCAISAMALPEAIDRRLEVIFAENKRNYICRLNIPKMPMICADFFEHGLNSVADLLTLHGGRVNLAVTGGGIEIFLAFPRKDSQIG